MLAKKVSLKQGASMNYPRRELDALIAEKVMGIKETLVYELYDKSTGEKVITFDSIPHYSTDIAAALEVVEKLKSLGWNMAITNNQGWAIWISQDWIDDVMGIADVRAETLPHCICLAALKAVDA
jgi:peptide subunit release factor RF-3